MPREHEVKPGECIASIAFEYGFAPETLWDHPDNGDLRELRGDPYVLKPSDIVRVPDREAGEASCATEATHRFRRKGVPEFIELVLRDEDDEPRADLPYRMEIDGRSRTGKTDANGLLREGIPMNARSGRLFLGKEYDEEWPLDLGVMDPVSEWSGFRMRLNNLGYDCPVNDEPADEALSVHIAAFQKDHGLEETGEADDDTRAAVKDAHGC